MEDLGTFSRPHKHSGVSCREVVLSITNTMEACVLKHLHWYNQETWLSNVTRNCDISKNIHHSLFNRCSIQVRSCHHGKSPKYLNDQLCHAHADLVACKIFSADRNMGPVAEASTCTWSTWQQYASIILALEWSRMVM